jgi:hypothetical protein
LRLLRETTLAFTKARGQESIPLPRLAIREAALPPAEKGGVGPAPGRRLPGRSSL